jgi:nicotinate-nucleotide adenylyltransferase
MRIGVFGGSFDPVHLGHLILAEQCREQAGLEQVLFVPAARPPHKRRQLTPFAQRVEMLELAISGHPAFRIDELEKDRPGPSYTADTLAELQQRHAGDELWLMIGGDTFVDLPGWYRPQKIVAQAGLVITARPGWHMPDVDEFRRQLDLPEDTPLRSQQVTIPQIDISSTDLRQRVAEGRSIRYLVPRAVEAYIENKGLYRTEESRE